MSALRVTRLGLGARQGAFLERFRQKKKVSVKKGSRASSKEFAKAAMGLRHQEVPARSSEQMEKDYEMAKQYHYNFTGRHNRMRADEAMRLRMKKAAIEALPLPLRELALVEDLSEFPPHDLFTDTPAIPNFTRSSQY